MKFWNHNLIDVDNLRRGKTEKYEISRGVQKKLTANSTMRASTMLPTTVMKSNVFQASLK
jgi:hypothetical protein